ncbi:hypothetical protein TNCV_3864151 [Trichonephila clavipes]|nr:hypothetical protein TNCV_3864151 [Trichonephila clavipes]
MPHANMASVDFCIMKIHRLEPGSKPQPWVQKAIDKPTTPPNRHRSALKTPKGSMAATISRSPTIKFFPLRPSQGISVSRFSDTQIDLATSMLAA